MPASLKDLRTRIKSVKNTQQITKAMKLVSAAKFGRASSAVVSARPYAVELSSLVSHLTRASAEHYQHPLTVSSEKKAALVVVVSSERGLCGGYNTNLVKMANRTIDELKSEGYEVSACFAGKKAFIATQKRRWKNVQTLPLAEIEKNPEKLAGIDSSTLVLASFDKPGYDLATRFAQVLSQQFLLENFGRVVLVYSKFQSAMSQLPSADIILPVGDQKASGHGNHEGHGDKSTIVEPSARELVDTLLPRYFATKLFQAMLEASASEHGARMTAMDSATRNAKDMQKRLEITYQRARQAAITNELIEIISGAEAL